MTHPTTIDISLSPNRYTSQLFTSFSVQFEQITSFALMALGTFTVQLYKLLQSKQEKEWAKNHLLVRMEINLNPGISLRGLSRTTGLAIGSTQYWVRILEENNEIDILELGRSNHYFIREQQLSSEEKLLYALTQNNRIREILQSLNENPEIHTQKDLCTKLGYNKSLLSYYVKILKNHNVIESEIRNLSISEDFQSFLN
jgi:predicted transcriptional regulator